MPRGEQRPGDDLAYLDEQVPDLTDGAGDDHQDADDDADHTGDDQAHGVPSADRVPDATHDRVDGVQEESTDRAERRPEALGEADDLVPEVGAEDALGELADVLEGFDAGGFDAWPVVVHDDA